MSDFSRSEAEFLSDGITLRGWLYRPAAADGRVPVVVMTHGITATAQGMVANEYAETFVRAGIGVLLFDGRTLGRSDGEPRAQISSWWQARDYIRAVTWVREEVPWADPDTVAIWGDSFSGHTALVVASVLDDLAAVTVQVPACGRSLEGKLTGDSRGRFEAIREVLVAEDLSRYPATVGPYLPVVSPDHISLPSQLEPITAYHWFIQYGARFGTGWQNRAARVALETPEPFDAHACVPFLTVPAQMAVAPGDEMPGANVEVAMAVYERIAGEKELVEIDGGHFGLVYLDHPAFEATTSAQRDFLVRRLLNR